MASKEEQSEQEQLYENYLNVIQPGTKVVGMRVTWFYIKFQVLTQYGRTRWHL